MAIELRITNNQAFQGGWWDSKLMLRTVFFLLILIGLLVSRCAKPEALGWAVVPNSGLDGHVIVGYQGWFGCRGDDGGTNIPHWQYGNRAGFEMLPDLSEIAASDRCHDVIPGVEAGQTYSSGNSVIVNKHFLWMKQSGLHTVAAQRFVSVVKSSTRRPFADRVLNLIKSASQTYGRTFFVEYDLSESTPADIDVIIADWRSLISQGITRSPSYQLFNGHPLVGLFGFGFADRPWTPAAAARLLAVLREEDSGASLMLGIPTYWRTGDRDASSDAGWLDLYSRVDAISPWTVGRFGDDDGVNRYYNKVLVEDFAWANNHNVFFLPVAFPGFSWANLKGDAKLKNQIPRQCGIF